MSAFLKISCIASPGMISLFKDSKDAVRKILTASFIFNGGAFQ